MFKEITDDNGVKHITKTDSSGNVWWISQDENNAMYQEYLDFKNNIKNKDALNFVEESVE